MKNTIKMKAILRIAGIIAFVAVIGFAMVGCATGGGKSAADDTKLADVAPGDVPANLVGRWFDDARKRSGDFEFEITADGKFRNDDGDAFTIHADETHLWLVDSTGAEMGFSQEQGQRNPYRISGNTLYITSTVMGMTVELELFK